MHTYKYAHTITYKRKVRHTGIHTCGQRDIQSDSNIQSQSVRQADIQTHRQTGRHKYWQAHTCIHTDRHAYIYTGRQAYIKKQAGAHQHAPIHPCMHTHKDAYIHNDRHASNTYNTARTHAHCVAGGCKWGNTGSGEDTYIEKQAGRHHTYIHTCIYTSRQAYKKHADMHPYIRTYRRPERTYIHAYIHTNTNIEAREANIHRERHACIHTHRGI